MSFIGDEWKPTVKQAQFLSIPWTIKEAFYGGGAGSAKTDVLIIYGIAHRLHENPRFKQVLHRRTFPELRKEIVPRTREIYSRFGATFNRGDMAWTFPRLDQFGGTGMTNQGAIIFLDHCEDENDVHKFDSMEINLWTPDELTSFTKYIYLYIGFTRTRTSDPNLPAVIRAAGMPGNVGHNFVKERFVKPYPAGGKIIVGRGGIKRVYIHATAADNPHLDPGYRQSLEALPEAEKKAKLYGDWDSYLGQVFEEFRDRHYPDEPESAIHVIEPFEIPEWWPRVVVIDWGFAAMNYVSYTAISPFKRAYTYREQGWKKTKIEDWAPYVKEYLEKEKPRKVLICRSAGQDRGQEHTIQQQVSEALGYPVELVQSSPGSRVAGKALVHEYLRWKPKPMINRLPLEMYSEEKAAWLMRNRSPNEYKAYINSFTEPEVETNLPKWQIFNECPLMIESIKACSYDKPKKNGVPIEDVAEFMGDDPYDNARYLIDAIDKYFDDAIDEYKTVQKQQDIINRLNATNNFTAYYMNMRRMESEGLNRPINRYHHR